MKEPASRDVSDDKQLTLVGHLRELRWRLIRSLVVVAIATIASFFFAERIFNILKSRTPDVDFVFVEVGELLGVYMKVSLYAGLFLSLPYVIYEAVMFVSPALTRREKMYLYLLLPSLVFLFLAGALFGYFILLPPALRFIINPPFAEGIAQPMIRIGNYVAVLSRLLFFIGLSFETPLVLMFLSKIGIVNPDTLARYRRYAILGAFIMAAIITPTFDPVNQTLVAVPLVVLYELGIWLGRLVRGRKVPAVSPKQPAA